MNSAPLTLESVRVQYSLHLHDVDAPRARSPPSRGARRELGHASGERVTSDLREGGLLALRYHRRRSKLS